MVYNGVRLVDTLVTLGSPHVRTTLAPLHESLTDNHTDQASANNHRMHGKDVGASEGKYCGFLPSALLPPSSLFSLHVSFQCVCLRSSPLACGRLLPRMCPTHYGTSRWGPVRYIQLLKFSNIRMFGDSHRGSFIHDISSTQESV